MAWLDSVLIEQLGMTLLHFLWQGLLIGILYWLTLVIVRPASAQARYNLAVATLLAMGLTPVLTFLYLGGSSTTTAAGLGNEGLALMQIVAGGSDPVHASGLLAWTVAGWLAGVLLLSARLILGWHYIIKLRRSARRQALAHLAPLLDQLRHSMAIRKSVVLAVSDRVRSPVVVGWLRPLILFPPALINRLSPGQVEMILAHELAHIRRHDHLINLAQTVIETLLFYHPVVALISRRIRIERENACDDLAVSSTGNRLAYVEMLATLEHLRQPGPRLALGVQDGQIVGRIRRLVERSRPRRQLGVTLPALLGLLLAASAVGVQMMPPPETEQTRPEPAVQAESRIEPPEPVRTPDPESASTAEIADEPAAPASLQDTASEISQPAPTESLLESPVPDNVAVSRRPAAESASLSPESAVSIAPGLESQAPAARLATNAETGEDNPPPPMVAQTDPVPSTVVEETTTGETESQPEPARQPADAAPALDIAMRPEAPPAIENSEPLPPIELEPRRLTGGELIRRIEPDFPRSAQRRGVNGLVELEFTVDQRGQVQAVNVIEESPRGWDFGDSARKAIEQWRFEPYRLGEEPVEQQLRVEIDFDLADSCGIRTGSRLPRC